MNQLIAIALGGGCGAVIRFLISSGLYQWLGKGLPYGTLVVNVIGSFLIGLLSEALILQRLAFSLEYRAAILVGFIGAFTTFSTFSLETIYLIEEGSLAKAALNIVVSVLGCLFAVWIGLLFGRMIFLYSAGIFQWNGVVIAYGLILVNVIGAFLIGIISTILMQKVALSMEHRAALMIILVGAYLTLSGLYLVLFLIEQGYTFETHPTVVLATFLANSLSCLMVIWLGLLVSKQI